MSTYRFNITLPKDLIEELDQIVGPRKKSRFIADSLRDRLERLRAEKLQALLKEGYQARFQEGKEITQDFEETDLEGWDEY
jgi:metal-responsive CopG/Arc/MetJ family transcriptional regulator